MAGKLKNDKSDTIKRKGSNQRRPYKFTPEKKAKWLAAFGKTHNVSASCASIKINRNTVYEHRKADPGFAEKWQTEEDRVLDAIESKLYASAIGGDRVCMFFVLCNRRPESWRHKAQLEHSGAVDLEVVHKYVDPKN